MEKMPLRTSRRTTDRGRPPGLASGSNRLSRFHWVRVRSEGYRFDFASDRLGFMPNYRADLAFRTPFQSCGEPWGRGDGRASRPGRVVALEPAGPSDGPWTD